MLSEEFILKFFQLPEETVNELRLIAKNNNLNWIDYLNELYIEFNP